MIRNKFAVKSRQPDCVTQDKWLNHLAKTIRFIFEKPSIRGSCLSGLVWWTGRVLQVGLFHYFIFQLLYFVSHIVFLFLTDVQILNFDVGKKLFKLSKLYMGGGRRL